MVRDQSRFSLASFSRTQELEADQAGVKVLARAGFDPFGAPRFLAALGRSGGGDDQNRPRRPTCSRPIRARTSASPSPSRRPGARARPASARTTGARYLRPRRACLWRRPSRWAHSRPPLHPCPARRRLRGAGGLTLENTSQAVLGPVRGRQPTPALRAAETPGGQSLKSAAHDLERHHRAGSSRPPRSTACPVALAHSRGKEWSFRLSAIRIGGHDLSPDPGDAPEAATSKGCSGAPRTASGRYARGGRAVRPLKLEIVTASAGDTAGEPRRRMVGDDRPLERFLILNGLDRAPR